MNKKPFTLVFIKPPEYLSYLIKSNLDASTPLRSWKKLLMISFCIYNWNSTVKIHVHKHLIFPSQLWQLFSSLFHKSLISYHSICFNYSFMCFYRTTLLVKHFNIIKIHSFIWLQHDGILLQKEKIVLY